MQLAYKNVLLTEPPFVLGKQLKPFTLGFANILLAFDSPFLKGGKVTHDDLILGVWICSHDSYESVCKAMRSELLEDECRAWGENVGGEFDFQTETKLFMSYIDLYTKAPDRWDDGKNKRLLAPWPWVLSSALRRFQNLSPSDSWNTPVHEAMCHYGVAMYLNGDDSLMDEEALKLQERFLKEEVDS